MNTIRIIYEDDNIIVLDKGANIIVNKSDTTKNEYTVQDYLEESTKITFDTNLFSDFDKRAGIVHRIDKETSGLLLVAKNLNSFKNLQGQFKERVVDKTYVALVHGIIKQDLGEINAAVGRLPWNRKRFGVLADGRSAQTFFKVLERFEKKKLTLLELNPKTGRTHQIRVHLKYLNHPIFSDPLYAGRKTARDDRKILERVFLHAKKISFNDPKSGKKLTFESPLPYELNNTLSWARD